MKIRIALFTAALLLLPPIALMLSDQEWAQTNIISGLVAAPALLSAITLLSLSYILDTLSFKHSGSSLLRTQARYCFWLSLSGALLGALLGFLNIFSPVWLSPLERINELLVATLFGAILLPSVLIARLWLASIPYLLRPLTRRVTLPPLPSEPTAALLLLSTLIGLMGGALWPAQLAWLFWLAPLLLLIGLQLLWHESTVFTGLKNGDWSRIVLGCASGILTCGSTLIIYKLAGGAIYLTYSAGFITLLCGVFGLLCLQLGDIIAETFRGKKRIDLFKKKPFPIPVVVKKD